MVLFMNAFYALDDIKKRTKKFYTKLDEQNQPEEEKEGELEVKTKDPVDLFDDKFIFSHFYQNKLSLIKQHKKEEKEEREAYAEVMEDVNQAKTLLKKYFDRHSMPFCHYSGHNLWILKATRLNQGQGIHVCNSLAQVKNLISKYCEGNKG